MRKYLTVVLLLLIPALSAAALNLYATQIPFAIEGTLLIITLCLVTIAYRYTFPFYARGAQSQPLPTAVYTSIIASVIIFCVAQGIRLFGGLLYALTFLTDTNAFAYQMQYVLPNFFGGIASSFTTMVGLSFALGSFVVLPLIAIKHRRSQP